MTKTERMILLEVQKLLDYLNCNLMPDELLDTAWLMRVSKKVDRLVLADKQLQARITRSQND